MARPRGRARRRGRRRSSRRADARPSVSEISQQRSTPLAEPETKRSGSCRSQHKPRMESWRFSDRPARKCCTTALVSWLVTTTSPRSVPNTITPSRWGWYSNWRGRKCIPPGDMTRLFHAGCTPPRVSIAISNRCLVGLPLFSGGDIGLLQCALGGVSRPKINYFFRIP